MVGKIGRMIPCDSNCQHLSPHQVRSGKADYESLEGKRTWTRLEGPNPLALVSCPEPAMMGRVGNKLNFKKIWRPFYLLVGWAEEKRTISRQQANLKGSSCYVRWKSHSPERNFREASRPEISWDSWNFNTLCRRWQDKTLLPLRTIWAILTAGGCSKVNFMLVDREWKSSTNV